MEPYKADVVIEALAGILSFAWYGMWVGLVVVLIGAPATKLFLADNPEFNFSIEVAARLNPADSVARTAWGTGRLVLEGARADLKIPIHSVPWWFIGLLQLFFALGFGLILRVIFYLRRIFRRVRDGEPFDEQNARSIHAIGVTLLWLVFVNSVSSMTVGAIVNSALNGWVSSGNIYKPTGLNIDWNTIFLSLMILALAEIFRRGAALEREQALVV